MIKSFIGALMFLYSSSALFAEEDIVQGPFEIDAGHYIYIKKERDINFPLSLYLRHKDEIQKIDSYEVNGDTPNVESIFFFPLQNHMNIIVLISWKQEHRPEKISGRAFQFYGYIYNGNKLIKNTAITNDANLSGEEGEYAGEDLHYEYKDAESIKKYLKDKYSH